MSNIKAITNHNGGFEVTFVPSINRDELSEIVSSIDAFVRVETMDLLPKFSNGLSHCFLWAMIQVFGLSIDSATTAIKRLSKREDLGSTGVGRGLAQPHTQVSDLGNVRVCILQFAEIAFNFDSLDGDDASLFGLQVADRLRPGDDLRGTEAFGRAFRSLEFDSSVFLMTEALGKAFAFSRSWEEKMLSLNLSNQTVPNH